MALEGGSGDPSNKEGAAASVQGEAGVGGRPAASESGLGRTETGAGAGQPRAAPNLAHLGDLTCETGWPNPPEPPSRRPPKWFGLVSFQTPALLSGG